MGGWVLLSGNIENLDNRIRKFRNVFDVSGVPPLYLEVKNFNNFHVLLWSWSKPPIPDIVFTNNREGTDFLILHGIITGLGKFGDISDSQVEACSRILKLWILHGVKIFSELDGSFSCVFFNTREQTLTLITDRFASRTVWFSGEKKCWYVGNFPAAIAAFQADPPKLNAAGLWSLFAYSRHVDVHGIYHGMTNMPSSHEIVLKADGSFKMSHWRTRQYNPEFNISPKVWGEKIACAIQDSVRGWSKQISDPHLFLSGGLDSRIAAAAFGSGVKTHTLTTGFNMNARIAKTVANHLKIEHQTIIRSPYWYLDTFHAGSLIGGGNYNIQHAHFMAPVLQIMELNTDCTFLLGDLLENFNSHYLHPLNGDYPDFEPEKIPDFFHKIYSYCHPDINRLKRLFRPGLRDKLFYSWKLALMKAAKSNITISDDPRDNFDSLFRWNNCSCCPTYLMLECIRPLAREINIMFDNELADLLLEIPADVKGKGILHRWILWHLCRPAVFIPDSNSWLPLIFPNRYHKLFGKIRPIIGSSRRKFMSLYQGSHRPIVKTEGSWQMLHEWYRKDKQYREFIEECLNDKDAFPHEIFNQEEIKNSWKEFLNGCISNKFEIDILLSFCLLQKKIPTAGLVVP